jgi:hypothetical protein
MVALFASLCAATGAFLVVIGLVERRAALRMPPPPLDFLSVPSGAVRLRGRWRLGPSGWELEPLAGASDLVRVVGAVSLPREAEGRVGEVRGADRQGGDGNPFRAGPAHARVLVVRRRCDAFVGTLGERIARSATTLVIAGGTLAYAAATLGAIAAAD